MSAHASASAKASAGVPVLGLLGVLFVGLKLTGHIAWDWKWVTAPFWVPFAIFWGIAIGVLVSVIGGALFSGKK